MTENEAKDILTLNDDMKKKLPNLKEVYEVAIKALEEVQQYRAIGTVKEIKKVVQFLSMDNGNGIIEDLQLLNKYQLIGTVRECREAMEKQRAKKPVKDEYNHNCCPNCGWIVYKDEWGGRYLPHCENCGQSILQECNTD